MSNYVLFIDSGIGGLSTLAATMKICKANYLFYADNLFSPYGEKSDVFLKNRLTLIIDNLSKKYPISIVVLACNTATTTSINFLRKRFDKITFVGTEPATKLASDKQYKIPALIATPQTIKHFNSTFLRHAKNIPCKYLANSIENFYSNSCPVNRFNLLQNVYQIKQQTTTNDCVVLGCTHYSLIDKLLSKITQKPTLDGNMGVAKRVLSLNNNFKDPSNVKIILSDKNKRLLQKYKKILKQILANQINLC